MPFWALNPKRRVENCYIIDANELARRGTLRTGVIESDFITISRGFTKSGRYGYFVVNTADDFPFVTLEFNPDGRGDKIYYFFLAATPQNLGGNRWWFLCPLTGQRCAKLYLPSGSTDFASREAHGLVYNSQNDDGVVKKVSRIQKGRSRLGGSMMTTDPFPAKPKKMWNRTYKKYQEKEMENRAILNQEVSIRLLRIYARLYRGAQKDMKPEIKERMDKLLYEQSYLGL